MSPDFHLNITDLFNFDRQIQVNVTIKNNVILDRESFYHFMVLLENGKNVSCFQRISTNFWTKSMNEFPNF